MVVQVGTDTGQCDTDRDAQLSQIVSRANTGAKQNSRRAVNTGAENKIFGMYFARMIFWPMADEGTCTIAVKHEAISKDIADYGEP
jgi:hypothetical protein